jgi:PIN domain nuclease of toxin-antitoxin system
VIWEVLMLSERGRVALEPDAATWVRRVCGAVPFKEAPLNHEVAIQSRALDLAHQDPADRFLAATALVYDLTLVTADERLLRSRRIVSLANV